MDILISEDSEFDDSSIESAIDLNLTLEIRTHSLPKKTSEYISLILMKYLEECNLEKYFNKVNYCLSEIMFNAIKANVKRIYFNEKGLDINNYDDYTKGMRTFKTDTLENKEHYFEKLRKTDLYATLSLKIEKGNLVIEVRNNSVMTTMEAARVKEKIANFHQYTPEELALNFVDEAEGAGLGINTIMLTLKSFGVPGDNYQLFTKDNETVARLVINHK